MTIEEQVKERAKAAFEEKYNKAIADRAKKDKELSDYVLENVKKTFSEAEIVELAPAISVLNIYGYIFSYNDHEKGVIRLNAGLDSYSFSFLDENELLAFYGRILKAHPNPKDSYFYYQPAFGVNSLKYHFDGENFEAKKC